MTVLAYGALNPDLVHRVERFPEPGADVRSLASVITWGGKVANSAMALATWGDDVRLTGVVLGGDALGDALLAALDHPRLDLATVERRPDATTGHCVVLVTPDGERTMVCTSYDAVGWQRLGDREWEGVEVVVLDGFGGDAARAVAIEARQRRIPVVWPDLDAADAGLADVAVWSSTEHDIAAAAAIAGAAGAVVLTAGAGPTRVWTGGAPAANRRADLTAEPPAIDCVDATGAGDVFSAAVAHGLANGWDVTRWLPWANAAGAALAARGRSQGMPSVAAVDALRGER